MATCNEYYYAEDQDGNDLPGTQQFMLYHKVGGSWVYVATYTMPPGSVQSLTLTKGDEYAGNPTVLSGYTTPDPIELTACDRDFGFVYIEEIPPAPHGDILSGDASPTSQTVGGSVDIAVDIKNVGDTGGYFRLQYYEGTTHLRTSSRAWLNAGQTVTDISEVFTMPDRDFVVNVRIYNEATETIDDTYNVTCYLIGGTEYYVKVGGDDGLSGSSWAKAWATIDKAARTVPDGSTVHIGFGDYNSEPPGNKIAPQNIGSEGIFYDLVTAGSEGGTGTVTIEKNA